MYSFEGNFRKCREQNLSGSVRETRDQFLVRAHLERKKREDDRQKVKKVIYVQSLVRRYFVKKKVHQKFRYLYDSELPKCSNFDDLTSLLAKFVFFYERMLDENRLIDLCKRIVPNHEQVNITKHVNLRFRFIFYKFLLICLKTNCMETLNCLHFFIRNNQYDIEKTTLLYLLDREFFIYLKQYLKSGDIEIEFIFSIIFSAFTSLNNDDVSNQLLYVSFTKYILCDKLPEPVSSSLLFWLKKSPAFSFKRLITIIGNHLDPSFYTNQLIYYLLELESENTCDDYGIFLRIISKFNIESKTNSNPLMSELASYDTDDDTLDVIKDELLLRLLQQFNNDNRCRRIIDNISSDDDIFAVVDICYKLFLLRNNRLSVLNLPVFFALQLRFIFRIWNYLRDQSELNDEIKLVAKNISVNCSRLHVFCNLFSLFITGFTFLDSHYRASEFFQKELFDICSILKNICLNLIEVAFPIYYKNIYVKSDMIFFFNSCMSCLKKLHSWDIRLNFCPSDFWVVQNINVPNELIRHDYLSKKLIPFKGFVTDGEDDDLPPLTTIELRALTVLQEMPFVISFNKRISYLNKLCQSISQSYAFPLDVLRSELVTIRRTHLYEDAFEKFNLDSEFDMRKRIRIKFVNEVGLDEAGVDGGGIFKEFLNDLIKTAFDSNRGFFLLTNDNTLYPNPNIHLLMDDYHHHYAFIGQMIAKAIHDNIILDLPLAEFFMAKIFSERIETYHLNTFDPLLYKNLIYLKEYSGDVENDLQLDFSVASNDLGETRIIELKANGSKIPVNNFNKYEYIVLLADFKLNKQLEKQCAAFAEGIQTIVPLEWLKIFNYKELQIVISGYDTEINIDDLIANTKYGGHFFFEHPTIQLFWKIVQSFRESEKKRLLKFVTSCSRSPLLGFKELNPPFCIQSVENQNRMPTASTCLNLLKLPIIEDEQVLRMKLLSAIEQIAGFELS